MNVAIYARVSTNKQELENQLLQLRDYCKKSDWEIYDEYTDIITGKKNSRPRWEQLFNDAHKKKFDVILFWDLSRFSRSGTLYTLQKLLTHKSPQMTQRYAHLRDEALRRASDLAGALIDEVVNGKDKREVRDG